MPYGEIRRILEQVRQKHNLTFAGFGDMDTAQIAAVTGLDLESARRAQKRDYEETLCLSNTELEISFILSHIEAAGLRWAKGTRFYGVMGDNDKGMATKVLTELFRRKLGEVKTIGVGDSLNDVPMLAEVDYPVLVQKPGGNWQEVELPNLNRVAGIGPEGWVRVIKELVGE
jgi:mannosyl-3-phosphoglycerate phosphatase